MVFVYFFFVSVLFVVLCKGLVYLVRFSLVSVNKVSVNSEFYS